MGVTYRQLDYWARTNLLQPSTEARGSGTRRRYNQSDIRILRIIKAMQDLGISLIVIRRVIEGFEGIAPEGGSMLVCRSNFNVHTWGGDGECTEAGVAVFSPENRDGIFGMIAQGPCVALMIE